MLTNIRKSIQHDLQIEVKAIGDSLKDITVGDPIAKIGTLISSTKIGCQTVEILQKQFSETVVKSFSKYVRGLDEMAEMMKSSKFFVTASSTIEKVETVYGYVIPVGAKQYEDFKNHVNFQKHVSDLFSETAITWGTIEVASEEPRLVQLCLAEQFCRRQWQDLLLV